MSLYLKYRPKDFESLVGQEFIKKTLQVALRDDKMVSSYLLCGPRGTGKTTTARILAKGVNCLSLVEGNPCNNCKNCNSFLQDSLIDIIEIDAASYTGVDNIREIIERAQFQPTQAKYKVYIIDEVHMLSKGAFNALLKILEEPPKHVKFILATTETHKVPDTIISRCQRYDFKSISNHDIEKRLKFIAEAEEVNIDEASLNYISSAASGGLRNAISLFEQLIEGGTIEYDSIIEKLGLTDREVIQDIYSKLLNSETDVLSDISKLSQQGKDMSVFFASLLSYVKSDTIDNLGDKKTSDRIHILTELNKGLGDLKYSFDPEVTIMTMLSKLIGIYQEYVPEIVEQKVSVTPQNNSQNVIKQPVTENVKNIEEGLSFDDVDDIFGKEDTNVTPKVDIKKINGGGFDNEKYISTLRELKVKGALIISLKQARNFTMFDEYLEIVLQNNFTLKALNTGDNVLQLIQGLEKMGIEGKTVKLC